VFLCLCAAVVCTSLFVPCSLSLFSFVLRFVAQDPNRSWCQKRASINDTTLLIHQILWLLFPTYVLSYVWIPLKCGVRWFGASTRREQLSRSAQSPPSRLRTLNIPGQKTSHQVLHPPRNTSQVTKRRVRLASRQYAPQRLPAIPTLSAEGGGPTVGRVQCLSTSRRGLATTSLRHGTQSSFSKNEERTPERISRVHTPSRSAKTPPYRHPPHSLHSYPHPPHYHHHLHHHHHHHYHQYPSQQPPSMPWRGRCGYGSGLSFDVFWLIHVYMSACLPYPVGMNVYDQYSTIFILGKMVGEG